ncbi:MAG: lamin tail domain-containing protein [Mariniphaga sp.]|nr:lamin tail domain-containing protein [Mariniphaga sp.]
MLKNKLSILKLIVLVFLCVGVRNVNAQSSMDLRINEILVHNDSNYVDDFGQHSAWIEIYNSAYNSVNVGGLYLTDDITNPTKYLIPKGQPITLIPQESYIVFWADNEPNRGILHLNFKLKESKTICLFDSNGKTLIDSLTINSPQKPDITFGRLEDGEAEWGFLEKSTPNANNDTKPKVSEADKFVIFDPSGIGMALIAMSVVFSGLALLYLFFKGMGLFMTKNARKAEQLLKVSSPGIVKQGLSGEVNAAIVMALYLYGNELHDQEDPVITMTKVSRTYSPWSSKIYGLRKSPR